MLTNGWLQEQSIFTAIEEWEWLFAPILFTVLAFFTRNYKIGLSPIVTWDEAQYVPALDHATANSH
jgi:dolichyl-phosphate-mannose-protein mannosyltransferase